VVVTFHNLIDTIKFPFRKDRELYRSFFHILGFYPNHISYYKEALMHKSLAKKNKEGHVINNERLEFLGDAILDAVVGDIVYRHFSHKREGFLTKARSKIVQRETLGKLAIELGLDKLIMRNDTSQSHNNYTIGNAFEAMIGAVYLDKGYEGVMRFMERRIFGEFINIDKISYSDQNYKSRLLEWSQKNRISLTFCLADEKRDEYGNPIFQSKVMLGGIQGCMGKGYTKKESQQNACRDTLKRLKKDRDFQTQVLSAKEEETESENSENESN